MSQRLASAALAVFVLVGPVLFGGCGGSSGADSCTPATESCNGADDDCDGELDEPDATGCTVYYADADDDGAGASSAFACLCAPAAPYTLTVGGDCDDANPGVRPGAAESCNGVDDDCDAQTDEGIAGCCAPAAEQGCGVAQGVCAVGTSTCGGDFAWGPCLDGGGAPVVLPGAVAEVCDGIDNDCDAVTDEDFTDLGTGCSVGTGACTQAGVRVCNGAGDGTVCGATAGDPAAEACDGIDNDCDGELDEPNAIGCANWYADGDGDGHGDPGAGSCLCANPGGGAVTLGDDCDDAVPALHPGAQELCNGLDDDCDAGTADGSGEPTFGDACDGSADADLCADGTVSCELGAMVCADAGPGVLDLCNGADDDCSPATPDGSGDPLVGAACCPTGTLSDCQNTGTGSRCHPGAGLCSGAMILCAGSLQRSTETCNGIDDDCDGVVDDVAMLGDACSGGSVNTTGACTAGYTCNGGVPGPGPNGLTCTQLVGPVSEYCDGLDDDCDGATDEDAAGDPLTKGCYGGPWETIGVGVCVMGIETCTFAAWGACVGQVAPALETCNGQDDDCDAVADNNLTDPWVDAACCPTGNLADCQNTGGGTRCHPGAGQCLAGGQSCVGAVQKSSESCNSVDDDCDGLPDDVAGIGTACVGPGVNTTGVCTASYTCNGTPGPGPSGLTCTQLVGPTTELCGDGFDTDCDGDGSEFEPGCL